MKVTAKEDFTRQMSKIHEFYHVDNYMTESETWYDACATKDIDDSTSLIELLTETEYYPAVQTVIKALLLCRQLRSP